MPPYRRSAPKPSASGPGNLILRQHRGTSRDQPLYAPMPQRRLSPKPDPNAPKIDTPDRSDAPSPSAVEEDDDDEEEEDDDDVPMQYTDGGAQYNYNTGSEQQQQQYAHNGGPWGTELDLAIDEAAERAFGPYEHAMVQAALQAAYEEQVQAHAQGAGGAHPSFHAGGNIDRGTQTALTGLDMLHGLLAQYGPALGLVRAGVVNTAPVIDPLVYEQQVRAQAEWIAQFYDENGNLRPELADYVLNGMGMQ